MVNKSTKINKAKKHLHVSLTTYYHTYIILKKSNEIRMLVHIKEISKKRTKRIFHNILVLTFSLLLQIFRYNVYKCIYMTLKIVWR
jgi:hypothetical protein